MTLPQTKQKYLYLKAFNDFLGITYDNFSEIIEKCDRQVFTSESYVDFPKNRFNELRSFMDRGYIEGDAISGWKITRNGEEELSVTSKDFNRR
jgi:hypothetical protein